MLVNELDKDETSVFTDGGSVVHFSFYIQDTSPLKVSLSNSSLTQFSSSDGILLSFSAFPKPLAMNAEFSEHRYLSYAGGWKHRIVSCFIILQ